MTWTLISSGASPSANTTTASVTLDSTGGNLIVVSGVAFGAFGTISDNKGNTYTNLTGILGSYGNRLSYKINPTVGTSHTITITGSFPSIQVEVWSSAAPTFDQDGGGGSSNQPGSITPAEAGELFVCGLCDGGGSGSVTINSGFTISDQNGSGAGGIPGAIAYLVNSGTTAQNPTWSGTNVPRTSMGTWKAGSSGSVFTPYYYQENIARMA